MAKVINLTNIKISEMVVDMVRATCTVKYVLVDDAGKVWGDNREETYWATLPPSPGPTDVLLPATYVTTFTNLYTAALTALKSKYLV